MEFSPVLTDENLVYLVKKTNDEEKEKSICKRETVSEDVSNALIEKGHEEVVATLLNNKGAQVSEDGYNKILDNFNETEGILSMVKQRAKLPISVMKALKEDLTTDDGGIEVTSTGEQDVDKEHYQFMQLVKKRGIQENIATIYALCLGNIKLFEICAARKLKVPLANVKKILDDGGDGSFRELYKRIGAPDNLFDSTETLMCVLNNIGDELDGSGVKLSQRDSKRIITNMMMYSEEEGGIENMEYMITLIRSAAS